MGNGPWRHFRFWQMAGIFALFLYVQSNFFFAASRLRISIFIPAARGIESEEITKEFNTEYQMDRTVLP